MVCWISRRIEKLALKFSFIVKGDYNLLVRILRNVNFDHMEEIISATTVENPSEFIKTLKEVDYIRASENDALMEFYKTELYVPNFKEKAEGKIPCINVYVMYA